MIDERITGLISELQKYDNDEGYKLKYENITKKLKPCVDELVSIGEPALDKLHELLESEETWSCYFALKTIGEIKNIRSIPFLVSFIEKNDAGDYWESCEGAMNALIAIGDQAVPALLDRTKDDFKHKKYYSYLTSALTGIINEQVYEFMNETLADYVNDYKKYDGWFDIVLFTHDFDKQGHKETLPLLKQLSGMAHLSQIELQEINSTIESLEDPEGYEKRIEKEVKEMVKDEDFWKDVDIFFGKHKLTEQEHEEFIKRSEQPDENFEANFICKDCHERQNIKTGLIWSSTRKESKYSFHNEIMCKYCHSHAMKLTKEGQMEITGKTIRILAGKDTGLMIVDDVVLLDGTKIGHNDTYNYIIKKLTENPEDGELYLRAGNIASKSNKFNEAIGFYLKSIELNKKLIAPYINLIEIYLHRSDYYGMAECEGIAKDYFSRLVALYMSHNFDTATIRNEDSINTFLLEYSERFGFETRMKIGRNDPCPCGSGRKYKKCHGKPT